MKIAVIGCGNMGSAIIGGLIKGNSFLRGNYSV